MAASEWEQTILLQVKQRDPAGLESIMDAYAGKLYGLAGRILHGIAKQEDIEECVSDVFVAFWEQIDRYDPDKGDLLTWLYMLTKFRALDYRRKMIGKPAHRSFDQIDGWTHSIAGSEMTEQIAIQKEHRTELLKMLHTLPEMDRAILYRRYYADESTDTIAAGLSLSVKAVENRLRRARQILKMRLLDEAKEGWL